MRRLGSYYQSIEKILVPPVKKSLADAAADRERSPRFLIFPKLNEPRWQVSSHSKVARIPMLAARSNARVWVPCHHSRSRAISRRRHTHAGVARRNHYPLSRFRGGRIQLRNWPNRFRDEVLAAFNYGKTLDRIPYSISEKKSDTIGRFAII